MLVTCAFDVLLKFISDPLVVSMLHSVIVTPSHNPKYRMLLSSVPSMFMSIPVMLMFFGMLPIQST